MGITHLSLDRMKRFECLHPSKRMLELGCQNIYVQGYDEMSISLNELPKRFGVNMETWDILGCQNSKIVDLREPIDEAYHNAFDVVTDFGTTEHVDGNYYQARKNIHDACKVGGIMIHENPMTGHWIGHGCNYLNENFYRQLADAMGYEILELVTEYAMGNITDGGNVSCVLRKREDTEFVSEEIFSKFDVFRS
jgi:hypothetical protein